MEAAITESEIISRVAAGDQEAYGLLVQAHQAYLYQLCLAVLAHPQDAEEAAQVAFIKAHRGLGRFRQGASFRTWLTRIAINQCKDMLRQRRRQRALSLDALLEQGGRLPQALVQDAPSLAAPVALSQEAAGLLSQAERDILSLVVDEEGISYEALAARLSLSLDAVRGRLKRARQKLKAFYSSKEDSHGTH
jgi:RNA polymerase sigma-70 factor (ECF subfamily)